MNTSSSSAIDSCRKVHECVPTRTVSQNGDMTRESKRAARLKRDLKNIFSVFEASQQVIRSIPCILLQLTRISGQFSSSRCVNQLQKGAERCDRADWARRCRTCRSPGAARRKVLTYSLLTARQQEWLFDGFY